MDEAWKEVLGYDTLYEVSNLGRVRTRRHDELGYTKEYRFVEPCDNGKGYLRFNWKVGGKQKTAYLHRLVAEAFIPNPEGLNEINHLDEDKTNCRVDNLEWCTHAYNCRYGTRNIRSGEKRGKAVVCVETGVRYGSLKEACEKLGVVNTALSNCLNGRSNTCIGYHWRYEE